MNAVRLQKLILSMLHDPAFRAQMRSDPKWIEQTYHCSSKELAHMQSFDERLFKADPMRAARLLTGLFDVYPVSIWSVLAPDVFPCLRAFFASQAFHRVIWEQGFLHQSFADYLTEHYPQAAQYVRLECGIEDTRHVQGVRTHAPYKYVLHHSARVLSVKVGYLETFATARAVVERSAGRAAEFLLNGPKPLSRPADVQSKEFVLIEGGSDPQIGGISESLGRLLTFLQTPRSYDELEQRLLFEGAELGECNDLILSFLTNRWIEGQVFSPDR